MVIAFRAHGTRHLLEGIPGRSVFARCSPATACPTGRAASFWAAGSSPASRSLQELLRSKDLPGVQREFQRALATVETDPPAGVTAACSLLEALFKVYIEDERQELPAKQSIGDSTGSSATTCVSTLPT